MRTPNAMPKSDAHKQPGAFVPQDMYTNAMKRAGRWVTGLPTAIVN